MPERVRIESSLTFAQLQARLGQVNRALGAVTHIGTDGQDTVVDVGPAETAPSDLRLALDPAGAEMPSPREQLVVRGEAYVQGTKQKVAAFRRQA